MNWKSFQIDFPHLVNLMRQSVCNSHEISQILLVCTQYTSRKRFVASDLVFGHWSLIPHSSPDVGNFICGYLMLQAYMCTLFLCCSYWVRYDTALGTHQQRFLMIFFYGKWPYDGFIVIWMEFMTLTNIFYCSRGFIYFPALADGPIYSSLHDFGCYCVRSDGAIISRATLFYMWLLIDRIDILSRMVYDPWYQKHGLHTHTVGWEPIVPP